jgi:hypothetical protein
MSASRRLHPHIDAIGRFGGLLRTTVRCGLLDRLFDVMAHEAAGVERRRTRAALREHET